MRISLVKKSIATVVFLTIAGFWGLVLSGDSPKNDRWWDLYYGYGAEAGPKGINGIVAKDSGITVPSSKVSDFTVSIKPPGPDQVALLAVITPSVSLVPAAAGGTNFLLDGSCQAAFLFADDLTDACIGGSAGANDLTGAGTYAYEAAPTGHTIGKSVHFNGTDGQATRADAGLSAGFPGKGATADMAFCIWLKHDDNQADTEQIIYNGNWYMRLEWNPGANTIEILVYDGTEGFTWPVDVIHNIYTWRHYCFSFDGSATQGQVWVSSSTFGDIVNGTTTTFTNVNNVAVDDYNFALGSRAGSHFFDGSVYQPIVFNRVLSAAEAQSIFTYGITGTP